MRKLTNTCIFAFTLICSLPCWSADTLRTKQDLALSSAETAIEKALMFTGFRDVFVKKDRGLKEALSSAQLIVGKDDESPFISDLIDSKEVWKIKFESVFLDYKNWHPDWVARYNPKTFYVLLEPESGALLKIFSVMDEPDSNIAPEPTASATTQWYQQRGDIFLSTVTEAPKFSFYEALEQASGSSPLKAKEIIAWLTMMKIQQDTIPHPVWVILGRGAPVVGIIEPPGPEYKKNRWVSYVDASTGELRSVGSAPPVGSRDTWNKK